MQRADRHGGEDEIDVEAPRGAPGHQGPIPRSTPRTARDTRCRSRTSSRSIARRDATSPRSPVARRGGPAARAREPAACTPPRSGRGPGLGRSMFRSLVRRPFGATATRRGYLVRNARSALDAAVRGVGRASLRKCSQRHRHAPSDPVFRKIASSNISLANLASSSRTHTIATHGQRPTRGRSSPPFALGPGPAPARRSNRGRGSGPVAARRRSRPAAAAAAQPQPKALFFVLRTSNLASRLRATAATMRLG